MRLFIVGATGKTGVELVDLALSRGHTVTAYVRSPQKIVRRDEGLAVVQGDVRSAGALAQAMRGHDGVLSALGPTPREAIFGTTLLQQTCAATLAAMRSAALERFIIVSSAMLYASNQPAFVLSRWIIRSHYRDLVAMEGVVRASAAQWTLIRPPRLLDRRDERYEVSPDGLPPAHHTLAWRALAAFMLDAAESGRYRCATVGLCR
jgi:putative NADH-flavin reductase